MTLGHFDGGWWTVGYKDGVVVLGEISDQVKLLADDNMNVRQREDGMVPKTFSRYADMVREPTHQANRQGLHVGWEEAGRRAGDEMDR